MGVFIKGVEMPKNCWECSLSDVDDDYGRCCLFSGIACLSIGRQNNCPLIEVQTPHGRLIDADALTDKLGISDRDIYCKCVIEEDAPTIIEAEGSDT